ncbi:MAG: putative membrane protein YphA (DoxX/SURF4 family) [Bradymonadia bacterium]|jgi:uncharacterized membrane protein YphA (DoxX/SURF4 family)
MTTTLWIIQGVLALAFMAAGAMKMMKSRTELAEKMPFVEDLSDAQLTLIGALELAGAVGLILPVALNILPVLTGYAAAGLTLTMGVAAAVHIKRAEYPAIAPNVVLGGLAAYVAVRHLVG